jgi:ribosome-binding factor A
LKKKQSRPRSRPAWTNNPGIGSAADELIRRATAPKLDRKALQLCRQIEREISLIISGELDDDRVRDLLVLSVVPYPRTNLLLVTLQSSEVLNQIQLLELDAVVAGHKPAIRREVAMAINRRKAPELCFRVINPV